MTIKPWGDFSQDIGTKIQSRNVARYNRLVATARLAEHEMQLLAPWTNRTGRARTTLQARVVGNPIAILRKAARVSLSIVFVHGMWYGEFLENRWGGRFAIVGPTAFRYRRVIAQALRGPFRIPRTLALTSGPPNPILYPRGGRGGHVT